MAPIDDAENGSEGMTATGSGIARKIRRALRNDTGMTLSRDELQAFVHIGALEIATEAENQELKQCLAGNMSLVDIGSRSAATARLPTSGRLPESTMDRKSIAALTQAA